MKKTIKQQSQLLEQEEQRTGIKYFQARTNFNYMMMLSETPMSYKQDSGLQEQPMPACMRKNR